MLVTTSAAPCNQPLPSSSAPVAFNRAAGVGVEGVVWFRRWLPAFSPELSVCVADLESANSELQAELHRLKRAGNTLAQQQPALENSKTVLELHVHARTRDLQTLQRRYEHILNSAGEGICGLDSRIDPADEPASCGKAPLPKGKQACQPERRLAAGRNPMPSDDAKSDRGYFGLLHESTAGKLVREFVGKAVLIAGVSEFAVRARLFARQCARYAIESLRTAWVINRGPVRGRCGTHESGDYTPPTRVA